MGPDMFDPRAYHAVETLDDGRKVQIRAQRPQDREALLASFERASRETVYHRFFAAKRTFSGSSETRRCVAPKR